MRRVQVLQKSRKPDGLRPLFHFELIFFGRLCHTEAMDSRLHVSSSPASARSLLEMLEATGQVRDVLTIPARPEQCIITTTKEIKGHKSNQAV